MVIVIFVDGNIVLKDTARAEFLGKRNDWNMRLGLRLLVGFKLNLMR